jgi:hypothetical protein
MLLPQRVHDLPFCFCQLHCIIPSTIVEDFTTSVEGAKRKKEFSPIFFRATGFFLCKSFLEKALGGVQKSEYFVRIVAFSR